jgi:MerR family transcriptional regulator, light-induced transcriptional regulator
MRRRRIPKRRSREMRPLPVTTTLSPAVPLLRASARAYARATVSALESIRPGFVGRALPSTFASPEADIEVRILQLAEAVAVEAPELFADSVAWYRTALHFRGVAPEYLPATIEALATVLERELPTSCAAACTRALAMGQKQATATPQIPPSPIEQVGPHSVRAQQFLLATLEGRGDEALDVVRKAMDDGLTPEQIHDGILIPSQQEVGRMWMLGETPIADEHYASQLAGQVLLMLQSRVPRAKPDAPHVVAFAVSGNLHDLGVRVISQRLQLAGFRVTNLGADMPATDLPWALAGRKCDLLAVSATMLLHLGQARAVVDTRNLQLGGVPPILIGGGPFAKIPDLHVRLGADAGAGDAESAVREALRLTRR